MSTTDEPAGEPLAWLATKLWNARETWVSPADIVRELSAAPAPVAWVEGNRTAALLDELALAWIAMTETEPDKSRRETLRECADGLEMLADMVRRIPAAPALGLLASIDAANKEGGAP